MRVRYPSPLLVLLSLGVALADGPGPELLVSAERTTWEGPQTTLFGVTLLTPGWEVTADHGVRTAERAVLDGVELVCADAGLSLDAERLVVLHDDAGWTLSAHGVSLRGLAASAPWRDGGRARLTVSAGSWVLELGDAEGFPFALDARLGVTRGAEVGWRLALAGVAGGALDEALAEALVEGYRWLVTHQEPDGRWSAGDPRFEVGVSALAVLALLDEGSTHRFGDYRRPINRSTQWLKRQQEATGAIGLDGPDTVYNHALASLVLSESYRRTRDFTLKRYVEKSVEWSLAAQADDGGWASSPGEDDGDVAVSVWIVLSLRALQRTWAETSEKPMEGVEHALERARGFFAARLAVEDSDADLRALAAVAFGRVWEDGPLELPALGEDVDVEAWYFGTRARHAEGGVVWAGWRAPTLEAVLSCRAEAEPDTGRGWGVREGVAGGGAYATALNLRTLHLLQEVAPAPPPAPEGRSD